MKYLKNKPMKHVLTLLAAIGWLSLSGQVVDTAGAFRIKLKDSAEVVLLRGFDPDGSRLYYYLPTGLRLSARPDSTPQFSFLTYSETDGGEISGAILHFLLEWGLTREQESETTAWLKAHADSTAVLAGPASLELPADVPGFRISGKGAIADLLRNKLSVQPVAPVIPGTKMAFSYRLDGAEARLFQHALEHPRELAGAQVELAFKVRGGDAGAWYNLIRGATWSLAKPLDRLFGPVLNPKKPKK